MAIWVPEAASLGLGLPKLQTLVGASVKTALSGLHRKGPLEELPAMLLELPPLLVAMLALLLLVVLEFASDSASVAELLDSLSAGDEELSQLVQASATRARAQTVKRFKAWCMVYPPDD